MKKEDEIRVRIEDISSEGLGIGHADGMAVFIKDSIPGDSIRAKIIKMKKTYAFGRLVEVLEASPDRVEPACPVARACGGCQIQMMSYPAQLKVKENKVINNLVRIGGFRREELPMEPILPSPRTFRCRNKAQYPIGTGKDGKPVAGFYAGRTHSIIPCTDCLLGPEENGPILACLLRWMEQFDISAYDEMTGKGLLRHVMLRKGFETGEIQVCLIANGTKLPREKELVEQLLSVTLKHVKIVSIVLNTNTQRTNVILGEKTRVLWGKEVIRDIIRIDENRNDENRNEEAPGVLFEISAKSFFQVNPLQTRRLYALALEYANLTGSETVWDIYCGIGTISLCMAQKLRELSKQSNSREETPRNRECRESGKQDNQDNQGFQSEMLHENRERKGGMVYGVEIVPEAIENAKHNAKLNGLDNARFFVGKAEEVLPEKYEKEGIHADVIVADPPRKGCGEAVLETMVRMSPSRIVYVSCDSATLARDLKYLCAHGYELKKVRPADMFPNTVHVETIVLLCRTNS